MATLGALAPLWIAFGFAAILAIPIFRLLLSLKSRQTISQFAPEGHQKKQGTPTMGGIIIIVGALAALLFAPLLPVSEMNSMRGGFTVTEFPHLSGSFLFAALVLLAGFALIGFVDDFVVPRLMAGKRGLGWKQKIAMQVMLAIVATGLLTHWALSFQSATYVFIILFASNAYNFLDGLDGLAGSVLIALCIGLMGVSGMSGYHLEISFCLLALIGATLPFLFMNAPPAKIFMGDVGSLPIGALLGLVFSVLLWPAQAGMRFVAPNSVPESSAPWSPGQLQPAMILPLFLLSLVLMAELIPVPLQIFWVKVFKKKLFFYTPIHHAFEKKGVAETRVVWHFLLTQILLGLMSYTIFAAAARVQFEVGSESPYRMEQTP